MTEGYKPITIQSEKPEELPNLPELALQYELKGDPEKYKYYSSGTRWYWNISKGEQFDDETKARMLLAQKEELPFLVSAVMERACNLQCAHCLYQNEKSSKKASEEGDLAKVIEHMVRSMPHASVDGPPAKFMSAGRTLQPWHLAVFKKLSEIRPDVKLGVIDNGTFEKERILSKWPDGFKLDWLDISIDGIKEHHDEQRGESSYGQAIKGLNRAREVVRPSAEGGYVASLLTLTRINAEDPLKVADELFKIQENGMPLIDKLNLTTMGPTNAINERDPELEINVEDFAKAWEEIKKACAKYNTPDNERISLGLYRVEDVEKLATVVGEKKFMESFSADAKEANNNGTAIRGNFIELHIDGVPVSYLPISIWPPEEMVIEADAAYRVAYEGQFTLDELHAGKSKDGRNTKPYTVAQLTPETDFREVYEKAVDLYWQRFGHKKLDEEFAAFQRIRAKAGA